MEDVLYEFIVVVNYVLLCFEIKNQNSGFGIASYLASIIFELLLIKIEIRYTNVHVVHVVSDYFWNHFTY